MKMYKAIKNIKRLALKEKIIIIMMTFTSNEKSSQKLLQNFSKIFFIQTQQQCRTYYQSHKKENLNFAIVSPIVPNSKVETSSLDRQKMKVW